MATVTKIDETNTEADWNSGTLLRSIGTSDGELTPFPYVSDSIHQHFSLETAENAPLYIAGIMTGMTLDNLTFTKNQFNGSANPGEVGVTGTYFTDPFGDWHDIGVINSGVAFPDSADFTAYIMFSEENIFTRFSQNAGNAEHLIGVRYVLSSDQWQYTDNSSWINFTPIASDRLIAYVSSSSASSITAVEELRYPTYFASGDQGLTFDTEGATRAAIMFPFQLPPTEMGLSVRVYSHSTHPNGGGIIASDSTQSTNGTPNTLLFYQLNGEIVIYIGGDSRNTGVTLSTNTWTGFHVNWRSSDGLLELYKNGVKEYSTTGVVVGQTIDSVASLAIGGDLDATIGKTDQRFNGYIAPPTIYSRILTESESEIQSASILGASQHTSPPVSLAEAGRLSSVKLSWEDETGVYLRDSVYAKADLGTLPSVNAITIETQVRFYSTKESYFLNTYGGGSDTYSHFMFCVVDNEDDSNALGFAMFLDGGGGPVGDFLYTNYPIVDGKRHDIAFTLDNVTGDYVIYVDGGVIKSGNYPDVPIAFDERPLRLGYESNLTSGADSNHLTQGLFGYIKVWDTVRTQSEIQANLDKTLSGTESNLVRYWKFDEGSGTVLNDATGNVNGTLFGDWYSTKMETRVSLDSGSTWSNWVEISNGDEVAGIPADTDGRNVMIETRETMNGYGYTYSGRFISKTITATGSRALIKKWDGTQWTTSTNVKVWDGSAMVSGDPRVYTDGRWL